MGSETDRSSGILEKKQVPVCFDCVGLSRIPVGRSLEKASVCRVLYDTSQRVDYPPHTGLCFLVLVNSTHYSGSVERLLLPWANKLHDEAS